MLCSVLSGCLLCCLLQLTPLLHHLDIPTSLSTALLLEACFCFCLLVSRKPPAFFLWPILFSKTTYNMPLDRTHGSRLQDFLPSCICFHTQIFPITVPPPLLKLFTSRVWVFHWFYLLLVLDCHSFSSPMSNIFLFFQAAGQKSKASPTTSYSSLSHLCCKPPKKNMALLVADTLLEAHWVFFSLLPLGNTIFIILVFIFEDILFM